jgi:3-isopropylmalate dehydrogenase
MQLRIAVLPGDGIGPEVTAGAVRVLETVAARFGHELLQDERPVGWAAARGTGDPLPGATLDACLAADAVLLGAVGHRDAERLPPERRPEAGLLRLRRALGCYANLRPAVIPAAVAASSPLRPERVRGTDLLIVRELASGIYYGAAEEGGSGEEEYAANTMRYAAGEIRRIAEVAFALARGRRGEVTSVDKANVLAVSRLWRRVVTEVAAEHADVRCRHLLVDRAAMDLVLEPTRFDVLLTANLFGDILSDEAAAVVGSIGLLPSASLGAHRNLYEPVHGSAPEIAGKDIANPIGAILSVALMLRHSFGLNGEAEAIERAVEAALAAGLRTPDLAASGSRVVGTRDMAAAVAAYLAVATTASVRVS